MVKQERISVFPSTDRRAGPVLRVSSTLVHKIPKLLSETENSIRSQSIMFCLVLWFVLFCVNSRAFRNLSPRSNGPCRKVPSAGSNFVAVYNPASQVRWRVGNDSAKQRLETVASVAPKVPGTLFDSQAHNLRETLSGL